MDLLRAIKELEQERQRLDTAIARLEEMLRETKPSQPAKRRGRKRMSSVERRVVAQRMREYWARKRAGQQDDS
ncbi:MAG: hypothetical protein IT160_18275 [Bryobacterales bacterium]|nr:hypothetical protein [Bryobacterales bacterium]